MARKKNTRRGNNEGCIYQSKNGKWVASVTLGYDDDGKRIRKVFYGDTRTEVSIKMTALVSAKLSGSCVSVKNDAIEVLFIEWLNTFKKAEVSPRTFERCVATAKKHIFKCIGDMKIGDITNNTIQALLNNMLFDGYAIATVRKVKFLLSQFFEYARNSKFVADNPVATCKVRNRREHTEQTNEQYKAIPIEIRNKFLEVLSKSEILEPICLVQLFAGLRIGEVLALKWKDIDFDKCVINIDNAITVVPVVDKFGKRQSHKTVISQTKTSASVREVPMPYILQTSLKKWKQIRLARQITTGISFTQGNDLVFSNNDGQLRTYYGIKTMFTKLMDSNGLKEYKLHFHTLRHTYASMMFEEGVNPKIIQLLLGHKDVTTTIKTYNSVDRSFFKTATDILEAKFKNLLT